MAQLLRRREFGLELKRRESNRVQTEMVYFIALPLPLPSKLKRWSFHVIAVQDCKEMYKKRDACAELLLCSLNILLFDVLVAVAVAVVVS